MTTKPQASKRKRTLKKHQKAIIQAIESGKIKIKTSVRKVHQCPLCDAGIPATRKSYQTTTPENTMKNERRDSK